MVEPTRATCHLYDPATTNGNEPTSLQRPEGGALAQQ